MKTQTDGNLVYDTYEVKKLIFLISLCVHFHSLSAHFCMIFAVVVDKLLVIVLIIMADTGHFERICGNRSLRSVGGSRLILIL